MALRVPKFGNWENDVPYTVYFEKAKKARNAKTNPHIPGHSLHDREEAEDKNDESTRKMQIDQDSSTTKQESRVSREEGDLKKSTDYPKRISGQSVGSDWSFDSSSTKNKFSVSSEGSHGTTSSTAGRSQLRQVVRCDGSPDDGPAIPKFGEWDDRDPRSGERYTEVFNKVRADKNSAGGKSPIITTENNNFYGERSENPKGCGCFPWSRK